MTDMHPPMRHRVLIAYVLGLVAFACSCALLLPTDGAQDWTWVYVGAQLLREGRPVYSDATLYPWHWPQYYPLPALLLALPLALLKIQLAGALFVGLSSGLLAFGLTRESYARLGVFLSAPYWAAVFFAQWSPLVTAAAMLPGLFPLVMCKPNIGLPVVLAYPSRRGIIASAAILLLSIAVMPSWPLEWLRNLGFHQNFVPLLTFPGPLLLIALVRWRVPEARLLVASAALPQRFYDPLLLWVLPRTMRQSLLLSCLSWLALLPWILRRSGISAEYEAWLPLTITLFLYGPALFFVTGSYWRGWIQALFSRVGATKHASSISAKRNPR